VNATIHKIDERVRIDDLAALSTIYADVLERLLVQDPSIAVEPAE
jgi:acetylornithine deacetylase/succinyl-diaminopimelate desuccinylase-like protein